jgi:Zn-finger nucleic acid-binding protein
MNGMLDDMTSYWMSSDVSVLPKKIQQTSNDILLDWCTKCTFLYAQVGELQKVFIAVVVAFIYLFW